MEEDLMPPDCRCSKWVFNIKCNNMYQAQLVACHYSQVLGVHFSKNYLPIVNDIKYHIQLLMVINFGYWLK